MKSKVLIIATVASMIEQFNKNNINILQELGYEVHVGTNFSIPGTITKEKSIELINELKSKNVRCIQIDFARSPFDIKNNLKSYKQVKKLLNTEEYEIIHLHSPVGAAIGRLALDSKCESKIIYTAHGFHFFEGASKLNWLIYYSVEKILASKTDILITINEEDYKLAKSKKLGKRVELIQGVGVDEKRFMPVLSRNKDINKSNLGFDSKRIVLTYIGELSKRKNQEFLINSISKYKYKENIQLILVGLGSMEEQLKLIVKEKGLEDIVFFLGYRQDIEEILSATDIVVSTSYQEGLPVNIIEGMFCGKPILVSNCRGNRDLIEDGVNGFVYQVDDYDDFIFKLNKLVHSKDICSKFSRKNIELSSKYSNKNVSQIMKDIYIIGGLI